MSQRKTWTLQEDQILRQLYQQRAIKKWSTLSQIMENDYKIEGRSGKQCRQRYYNHLKNGIRKEKWSKEEEQKLVELHSFYGNRWSLISKLIKGRTENCVKNMFNSKLRKSIRLLNRFIYLYYRKTIKQIKVTFMNRLLEFTQTAHKKPQDQRSPQQNQALYLKNQILKQDDYEVHQMSQQQKIKVKALIDQINAFKKQNRKYQQGKILSKLRKRKLKQKITNQNLEIEEELALQPRQEQLAHKSLRIQQQKQIDTQKQHFSIQMGDHIIQFTNQQQNQSELHLCNMESFEFNLTEQRLELPIQIENYLPDISPKSCWNEVDFIDWSVLAVDWRNNFD